MKKILICAFCAATLLMTACSGDTSIEVQENTIMLNSADVTISVPNDWAVTSGKALYEEMLPLKGYSDVDSMIKDNESLGFTYYARACNSTNTAMTVISSQNITPESDYDEQVTLAEYARSVHDSTIFDYLASDYKTGSDSSFSETTLGNVNGYLSYFEVFTKDDEPEFNMGFSEFFFQQDELIYSVQVCYFDSNAKEEALYVINSISTK